uniref:NADH-ubiquinone oxidoreductase chain 1 n=1 Tax=Psenopsis anomala TaxID=163124 RepID=A0A1V1FTD7_PSEAK|nr:NADH dehydrogenase subunit 1 [Psenopsis anomala]BBU26189.1 NADH dehydrogenase subunit 1 [Psenopsis anomala]
MLKHLATHLIHPLSYIVPTLVAVAYLTLVERKVLSYMQARKGPNVVGPYALLQPLADGVKLFTKESLRPYNASTILFTLAPMLSLITALIMWAPMPIPYPVVDINLGLIFILAVSSLSVYSILASGWASNSKYALMGALRAVSQTISYEVSLGLILLATVLLTGGFTLQTFSTTQEGIWLIFPAFPLAAMWYVSTLAETGRAPFDLIEGESELVSGFNVEYSAGPFALFFLAEYSNILLMNTLSALMFLGPSYIWQMPELGTIILMIKASFLSLAFIWARASFPRFRYDQLMHLIWKNYLPMTLALLMFHLALLIAFAGLPPHL